MLCAYFASSKVLCVKMHFSSSQDLKVYIFLACFSLDSWFCSAVIWKLEESISPLSFHNIACILLLRHFSVKRDMCLENNWQIFMIHVGKVGITTCSFEHLHLQLWSVLSTLRIPRLCRNADIQQPKPSSWLGWSMPSELSGTKLQDL